MRISLRPRSLRQSTLARTGKMLVQVQPGPPQTTDPTDSLRYPWGVPSGLAAKRQGLHTHCHFGALARERQGQNDVPQLSDRVQTFREAPERPSTLPLPPVL